MSTNIQVRAGEAYIPRDELLSLVVGVFRARLSHNLSLTCRSVRLFSCCGSGLIRIRISRLFRIGSYHNISVHNRTATSHFKHIKLQKWCTTDFTSNWSDPVSEPERLFFIRIHFSLKLLPGTVLLKGIITFRERLFNLWVILFKS